MDQDLVKQAEAMADALIGTCEAAPDALFEVEGLADAFDELAFECQQCGWWCAIEEMSEKEETYVCRECESE